MAGEECRYSSNIRITLIGNLGEQIHESKVDTRLLDRVRTGFWLDFLEAATKLGLLFRTSKANGFRGTVDTEKTMSESEAGAAVSEFHAEMSAHFAVKTLSVSKPKPWFQI